MPHSYYLFHNNTASLNDLWFESHASIIKMVAMELGGAEKIPELLEKYLGPKMKIKAPKDPDRPKRPKTSYFYYCDQFRPALIEAQRKKGKVQIGNIAKSLGKSWAKLTIKQKKPFHTSAEKDKERYINEIGEYNEKFGL